MCGPALKGLLQRPTLTAGDVSGKRIPAERVREVLDCLGPG
jgi:hypothetical protein